MEWYWYLVIVAVVLLVGFLIALFGGSTLKKVAYQVVLKTEEYFGSGDGAIKLQAALESLEDLTHGWIPASILKLIIEWAVKKMNALYESSPESEEKYVAETKAKFTSKTTSK